MSNLMDHAKKLLILPPLALGIVVFLWMNAAEPQAPEAAEEAAVAVRVIQVRPASFSVETSGFGRLEAETSWSAIAEVEGQVVELTDGLSIGTVLNAGAHFITIDRRDYEIALDQALASHDTAEANLAELDVNEQNYRDRLEVEREILAVLEEEFERQVTLLERGSAAQTARDDANRALLAQRAAVVDLEAALSLVEPQRAALRASLASAEADIERAERDLASTVLRAPFPGRVTELEVERDQYVRVGDQMATLEALAASEVEAAFQIRQMGNLLSVLAPDPEMVADVLAMVGFDAFSAISAFDLAARVRLEISGERFEWPAEIIRATGRLDAETGALGLVVRVENPTRPVPGVARPPLANGTFVEVILSSPEVSGALLVPRGAVQISPEGAAFVYLADSDDRLARAEVEVGTIVGNDIVITQGLEAGDRVVLSDFVPTVLGMKLAPVAEGRAEGT